MLTIFLLLLLSQTHAVIGNYNIDCLPSPGLPVPLGDCLDALTKIPPATIHRDDFLRPFTFRAGHCAIAVARDPPDSTLHPPQNVVDAMLNIVWPDIKHIAQNVVRKCVREEMGMAGMCLGNNLIEGRWYGYSVKSAGVGAVVAAWFAAPLAAGAGDEYAGVAEGGAA
ncbi:hypothetical protein MMC30_004406 [Trapelia coarctata]|nr:hypothetical protein [Trapelia coarctata]